MSLLYWNRVAVDPAGFVVVHGSHPDGRGGTFVYDLENGGVRVLEPPQSCFRIAAGAGTLLWHCEDEPRLADLRTGAPLPVPPSAGEVERRRDSNGISHETVFDVDGPVGARWLGYSWAGYDEYGFGFIDRETGRVVDRPRLGRGEVIDPDAPDLRRRMCAPIRRAVYDPRGYASPWAAWRIGGRGTIFAQRCGSRRVRRLGACDRRRTECRGPVVARGWAAWEAQAVVRAHHLPTGRRQVVRNVALVGIAGRWLVVQDDHHVWITELSP